MVRALYRLLAVVVAIFFIAVFGTLTVRFIRYEWLRKKTGSDVWNQKHIGVVNVHGILYQSKSILKRIKSLQENPLLSGIVVRVNSPGGVVAPSQEIYEALKNVDQKIPVVVSMATLAASGGYYISLGGRKIFALPGTITGSVGVIIEFVNLERLLNWARIERFEMTAGKLKAAGTPNRPMRPEEKQLFENLLYEIHEQFKQAIRERRKMMSKEDVEKISDGRVLLGSQAKELKLIDELGTFEDALQEAKKLAGLPPSAPVNYDEPDKSFFRKFFFGDSEESYDGTVLYEEIKQFFSARRANWRILLLAPLCEY